MLSIKLLNEKANDLRRLRLDDVTNVDQVELAHVVALMLDVFPAMRPLVGGRQGMEHVLAMYHLFYVDNEGDRITISNSKDLQEGIRIMQQTNLTFKLVIRPREQRNESDDDGNLLVVNPDLKREEMKQKVSSLIVCLDGLSFPSTYDSLVRDICTMLRRADGQTPFLEVLQYPEWAQVCTETMDSIIKGDDVAEAIQKLIASQQIPHILTVLNEKCPQHRDLLAAILHLTQLTPDECSGEKVMVSPDTASKRVPDTSSDDMNLELLLELVTGFRQPNINQLSDTQLVEILLNTGTTAPHDIRFMKRHEMIQAISLLVSSNIDAATQRDESSLEVSREDGQVMEKPKVAVNDRNSEERQHFTPLELKAAFIADVSIPDGEKIQAGEQFSKTWKIQNAGTLAWPDAVTLVRVGGDALELSNGESVVSVGAVLPGEYQEISVRMVAPKETGRYVSYWRLQTPDGIKFGDRVWVDIVVPRVAAPWNSKRTTDDLACRSEVTNDGFRGLQAMSRGNDEASDQKTTVDDLDAVHEGLDDSMSGLNTPSSSSIDVLNGTNFAEAEDEAEAEAETSWTAEMAELANMGFTEKEVIYELLLKYDGNMQRVINHLLG